MALVTPHFKVILCGEYGAGKSSIFRRFVDNSFTSESGPSSTIGLDHYSRRYNTSQGQQVELDLWDTAGIERFATLSSSYYSRASVALVCYTINNRDSLSRCVQHILEAIEQTKTAKILLCGTKLDLAERREVVKEDVDLLQDQLDGIISGTFEVSCKSGEGMQEMFEMVAELLHRQMNDRFLLSGTVENAQLTPANNNNKCC